ncbi:Glycine/D-amino acid oxidase [Alteribacillus persepolensis]|uniref:Glycine/D-amino acid oxidase n=1 Tax=Alteribacillus persepolensis TaxID=568899 RepID=A0A1G8KDU4_9BACI|nr:FAD-dependent oxidoreductase [Alteribacillus persepolensis]SDI41594.1 Glycine/D-amino acid oxidase [Alteribacillus persepolensis]
MKQGQHSSISYWLETCGDNLEPRTQLNESINTDVAILGAGFTGLWTAYYLSLQYPDLNIVVLEKEITGYGASGRNGGWCSPKFPVTPNTAIKRYGLETARNLQLTMIDSVYEVERVIKEEKIDADWALSGSLQVALGEYGTPTLEKSMETYRKLGLEGHFQLLNKDQTKDRVHIPGAKESLFTKPSAVLNPGKLVRQLANVLEKRGVKIYEQTEVTNIIHGSAHKGAKLETRNGSVTADRAIVLAGEAYMTQLPKFRRHLVPMYSLITITEPLNEEQWEAIGWKGRETVGSTRLSLDYMQKTADGRILFGGRGQPYRFASKISSSLDYHEKTHNLLKDRLFQWFPSLKGIRFTHDWGGPVGMTRDWTPNFFYNRQTKVAGAWGFVGQGVSTANLAGRILSDVLLEKDSSLTTLPMFQHQSKKWEPEPFRWAGIRFVQSSLGRIDEKAERTGLAPSGKTLAERLSSH